MIANKNRWKSEAEILDIEQDDITEVTRITLSLLDATPYSCPADLKLGGYNGKIVVAQGLSNIVLRFDHKISEVDLGDLITERDGKRIVTITKQ